MPTAHCEAESEQSKGTCEDYEMGAARQYKDAPQDVQSEGAKANSMEPKMRMLSMPIFDWK